MANYYYITIKSDKMTQDIASEIFVELSSSNLIRVFEYSGSGYLHFNSRGVTTKIGKILEKYDFTDEEVEVKDEFELVEEKDNLDT